MIIWGCTDGPNQTWTFQQDGTVRGLNGVCLDTTGSTVIVDSCSGATTWTRRPKGSITVPDGRCLTTLNEGTADKTELALATCNATSAQRWTTEQS